MSSSILTTHVGSLPRSKELSELLFAKDKKENFNQETFNQVVQKNVEKWCHVKQLSVNGFMFFGYKNLSFAPILMKLGPHTSKLLLVSNLTRKSHL